MIIVLCVVYIIIGLVVAIWGYVESYEIIMKSLKQAGKPTVFEKILFIMIFIVSTVVLTLAWPVLVAMMICE